jgi:hypothetical protein
MALLGVIVRTLFIGALTCRSLHGWLRGEGINLLGRSFHLNSYMALWVMADAA